MSDEVFSARCVDRIACDRLLDRNALKLSIVPIARADVAKIFFSEE